MTDHSGGVGPNSDTQGLRKEKKVFTFFLFFPFFFIFFWETKTSFMHAPFKGTDEASSVWP